MQISETNIPKRNKTENVETYMPFPSPRHDYSRLFVLKLKRKKSYEHRQKEPPTTPPTRTTMYMTNGHPDRAWNRHVCFDIFCFVPFRYIRFAKLHSPPVVVCISFCFVPFRFVSVNFVTFHFVSFRFVSFW